MSTHVVDPDLPTSAQETALEDYQLEATKSLRRQTRENYTSMLAELKKARAEVSQLDAQELEAYDEYFELQCKVTFAEQQEVRTTRLVSSYEEDLQESTRALNARLDERLRQCLHVDAEIEKETQILADLEAQIREHSREKESFTDYGTPGYVQRIRGVFERPQGTAHTVYGFGPSLAPLAHRPPPVSDSSSDEMPPLVALDVEMPDVLEVDDIRFVLLEVFSEKGVEVFQFPDLEAELTSRVPNLSGEALGYPSLLAFFRDDPKIQDICGLDQSTDPPQVWPVRPMVECYEEGSSIPPVCKNWVSDGASYTYPPYLRAEKSVKRRDSLHSTIDFEPWTALSMDIWKSPAQSGVDLAATRLSASRLSGPPRSRFSDSGLSGFGFSGSRLSGFEFSGSRLSRSRLSGASKDSLPLSLGGSPLCSYQTLLLPASRRDSLATDESFWDSLCEGGTQDAFPFVESPQFTDLQPLGVSCRNSPRSDIFEDAENPDSPKKAVEWGSPRINQPSDFSKLSENAVHPDNSKELGSPRVSQNSPMTPKYHTPSPERNMTHYSNTLFSVGHTLRMTLPPEQDTYFSVPSPESTPPEEKTPRTLLRITRNPEPNSEFIPFLPEDSSQDE